jgi:hypothetical protein
VKFVNAKPVHFPPMERKWGNDLAASTAWKTAAIRDKDGSLGAGPDSYILIHDGVNDSIATDEQACEIKPTWGAALCKGDVGRLSVGGGGGGARGAGPARAGGPGGPGAAVDPGAAATFGPGAGAPRAGGAGPGAGGARAGGAGGAPAQQPVILSRNGKDYTVTSGNVRAGTEIKVTTERPSVSLSLSEMDAGSWVIFELPGFTTAATGAAQENLDALRKASDTSYYKGNGSLWVKVVSTAAGGRDGGASLQVSR